MQQKTHSTVASKAGGGSEARSERPRGSERSVAMSQREHPAVPSPTIETIVGRENMRRALKQVQRNGGAPGIDGMSVDDLPRFLVTEWPRIREELRAGTYTPHPVRRVEIPKASGGVRLLGIPAVIDRLIQQATMQVLQAAWDSTFSEHSHGFRPQRSAHGAIKEAQGYMQEGYGVVVDIDLEKFFDRVNHDILMGLVAKRVSDKAILKLIRSFLSAGVLIGGLTSPTTEGVPQGGPLSPLLSNLVLDQLDRELERRNHRFVRYADDCNIYVRSRRAGERVMGSVTAFLERKLKLKVNSAKSAIDRPSKRTFLGFSFFGSTPVRRRIAPEALARFKRRVRMLTRRSGGRNLEQTIEELSRYLVGWRGYFGFCETPSTLKRTDAWIRRRLRALAWKQWKTPHRRYQTLRSRGLPEELAATTTSGARRSGPWHMSNTPGLAMALNLTYLESLGLVSLLRDSTA